MAKDTKATLSRLGDNYQYIIALEHCINAKNGEVVYIEEKGDIAINDKSFEIKHHIDKSHSISDNHIDF